MNAPYNMEIFLAGVLKGSQATRKRHISQAKIIQIAISKRWHKNNPWTCKLKHLDWFIDTQLKSKATSTAYYYQLTINLIIKRRKQPRLQPGRKNNTHLQIFEQRQNSKHKIIQSTTSILKMHAILLIKQQSKNYNCLQCQQNV